MKCTLLPQGWIISGKTLIPAAAVFIALALSACGGSNEQATPTPHDTATATAKAISPATTAPTPTASQKPILNPGGSATFNVPQEDGSVITVTWTMGSKVVQTQDGVGTPPEGFENLVFNLTIKDDGTVALQGDPSMQYSLVWGDSAGRTDNTIASTASTAIPQNFGLSASDIGLESGLAPGHFTTGSVAWLVPVTPGAVALIPEGASTPVVIINYDRLSTKVLLGS